MVLKNRSGKRSLNATRRQVKRTEHIHSAIGNFRNLPDSSFVSRGHWQGTAGLAAVIVLQSENRWHCEKVPHTENYACCQHSATGAINTTTQHFCKNTTSPYRKAWIPSQYLYHTFYPFLDFICFYNLKNPNHLECQTVVIF